MKTMRWIVFAAAYLGVALIALQVFGVGSGSLGGGLFWLLAAAACWALVFFLPRLACKVSTPALLIAGVVNLLVLLAPTALLIEFNLNLGLPDVSTPATGLAVLLYLAPCCALVILALLLQAGLQHTRPEREAAACLVLAALLLAKTLHNFYWLLAWDNTDDPLDLLWMIPPVLIAIVAALSMLTWLHGRARWAGLYALFIPVLLIAVAGNGDQVDFRQLTQQRADRIAYRLQVFREEQGYYPTDLRYLKTPRYLLVIPGPMTMFYRQGWCYESDGNSYQLGAVYRNHWSEPLIYGKVFAQQGAPTTLPPLCARELAALRPLFADFVQIQTSGKD